MGLAARVKGVGAKAAHLVLFIILEVTFEPFDMAVAFESEDMRRQTVKEHAIVADDDGAVSEILKRVFQRTQRFRIEVVGRFVEQQNVAA